MIVLMPFEMVAPNLCVICEQTPDPDTRVIDTLFKTNIHGIAGPDGEEPMNLVTHLSGNKYVCEPCLETMCSYLEYGTDEDMEALQGELSGALAELELLKKTSAPALELRRLVVDAVATEGAKVDVGEN
jgi:hypothetical protein